MQLAVRAGTLQIADWASSEPGGRPSISIIPLEGSDVLYYLHTKLSIKKRAAARILTTSADNAATLGEDPLVSSVLP